MRAYLVIIAALSLVILILSGQNAWIYYKILTEGSLTLTEPNIGILVSELGVTLVIVLGALYIMVMNIRRYKDDQGK